MPITPSLAVPPAFGLADPTPPSPPDFAFRPGVAGKTALWGYGISTFLNVEGSMALGAKSLFWQGVGRFSAVGSVAGMSFTTGLLIGRAIDFLPTYFGQPRVSRSLEDGLYAMIGPAPSWAVGVVDFFA